MPIAFIKKGFIGGRSKITGLEQTALSRPTQLSCWKIKLTGWYEMKYLMIVLVLFSSLVLGDEVSMGLCN